MAHSQTNSNARKTERQSSNRKRPQGITKPQLKTPTRKSVRLEAIRHSQNRARSKAQSAQRQPFPSPSKSNTGSIESSPLNPKTADLFRKGELPQRVDCEGAGLQKIQLPQPEFNDQNLEQTSLRQSSPACRHQSTEDSPASEKPSDLGQKLNRKRKLLQAESPPVHNVFSAVEDKKALSDTHNKQGHFINHWIQEGVWPKKYFEEDIMSFLLARKKLPSLRRQQSQPSSIAPSIATPSDEQPREVKSAPYRDPRYSTQLETHGSYMFESDLGITDTSQEICQILLNTEQTIPRDSLFRDDLFRETCRSVQASNEAKVVRNIFPLICPSAEVLAIYNFTNPKLLVDSVNQGWNNSIPVTATRPQPDYSVGFNRSAFSNDQLQKLSPFVGDVYDTSFFMATYYMYFPFLTCETKCGASGLNIADRQNAHSMTLAVRSVVDLFRLARREHELHQTILAFSISHDDRYVRIYGHYALIEGQKTTFYRHPIRSFDFTELEGKEKWAAYKFTKNVYSKFIPEHLDKIRSAIDAIPADLNDLNDVLPSNAHPKNQLKLSSIQEPSTSDPSSQGIGPSIKPKLRSTVMLQQEIDWLKQELTQEREARKQQLAQEREAMEASQQQHAQEREASKQQLAQEREASQQQHAREREESKYQHTE